MNPNTLLWIENLVKKGVSIPAACKQAGVDLRAYARYASPTATARRLIALRVAQLAPTASAAELEILNRLLNEGVRRDHSEA